MFFSSRKKRGPDLLLDRKIQFFFGGAVLALIGIGFESRLFVGLAIAVLLMGIGLRFLPSKDSWPEGQEGTEEGDHHEDQGPDSGAS